ILRGNATESRDLGRSPKKSYLFFLTVYYSKISLSRARVKWLEECCTFVAFGALLTSLENPLKEIVFTPGRTHNRSRSLRIGSKGWVPLGRFRPSGVRLTTNLELVRTRGI
ncbi:hypothetical protein K504DRAFT_419983, partial [Pleomassaria siparia CBS 279.74]